MFNKLATKAIVVLNEQHSLMSEQEEILKDTFDSFNIKSVPANGWTLEEMRNIAIELSGEMVKGVNIIFASPVPALMIFTAKLEMHNIGRVAVFHNDRREKKELPNGKIIFTVAQTGWELATWNTWEG
jgi:hypothetical protein